MSATPARQMVHCGLVMHPSGLPEAVVLPPGKTVRTCQRCERQFVAGPAASRCPTCRYIGRAGHSRAAKYRWTAERDELLRERYDSRVPGRAAEIAAKSVTPWADRMSTTEAVLYIRHAYRTPKFTASTLYRWLREGRDLSNIVRPRRWLREEIDRCLGGVLASNETRGVRQHTNVEGEA